MATVKLFGNLRKLVDGTPSEIPGANVRVIVENLCNGYPSLCDALLEEGEIRPFYKITLNGHDIQLIDGLDTLVKDADQIAIFPPIAGG